MNVLEFDVKTDNALLKLSLGTFWLFCACVFHYKNKESWHDNKMICPFKDSLRVFQPQCFKQLPRQLCSLPIHL